MDGFTERKARLADIPAMAGLYDLARAGLRERGVDQWQDGTPNADSAREDIESGAGWVLEEDGVVLATAAVYVGHEPTYDLIWDGTWRGTGERYGIIHRLAVSPEARRHGAASALMDLGARLTREAGLSVLRCDTHRDNLPMRWTLERNGFVLRGVIRLRSGALRVAYEKLL